MEKIMRSFLLSFLLISALLYAFPSFAAPPLHYAKPMAVKNGPPLGKLTLGGLGRHPHADVMTETSSAIFIFPVVGSVAGGNHTYYRSETTIINNRSISQTVELFYFAQGISNCTRPSKFVTLQGNSWSAFDDILQDVFGETGLGSMIVQAVDDNGNFDQNANIDGTSRIWTPSPFSGGTLSQTFPAASFDQNNGTFPLSAYGLRDGNGFHTNMGVLNYAGQPRSFSVLINGVDGQNTFDFNVTSCSFEQFRIPDGNYGIFQLQVTAHDSLGQWYGYGSSVDEVTANNWSSVLR